MKKSLLFSLTALFFMLSAGISNAVVVAPNGVGTEAPSEMAKEEAAKAKDAWKSMSRKEKRAKKKQMKRELKSALKSARKSAKRGGASAAASETTILLVILAILLPPLAVGLYEGITNRFWISLLLTLLFFLPGIIYALIVILE